MINGNKYLMLPPRMKTLKKRLKFKPNDGIIEEEFDNWLHQENKIINIEIGDDNNE